MGIPAVMGTVQNWFQAEEVRDPSSNREADLPLVRMRRGGNGRIECVRVTNENDLFHAARQCGVDQSAIQQSALYNGYNHPFELATLRFVNRDGVGHVDLMEILLGDFLACTIETAP